MENLWPILLLANLSAMCFPTFGSRKHQRLNSLRNLPDAFYISQAAIASVSERGLISAADVPWISCASIAVLIRAQRSCTIMSKKPGQPSSQPATHDSQSDAANGDPKPLMRAMADKY